MRKNSITEDPRQMPGMVWAQENLEMPHLALHTKIQEERVLLIGTVKYT